MSPALQRQTWPKTCVLHPGSQSYGNHRLFLCIVKDIMGKVTFSLVLRKNYTNGAKAKQRGDN